jgi:hypothetical protein
MAPLALCTKYGSADGHISRTVCIKPSAALQARMCNNNEPVAMKKVLQDKRFKACAGHLMWKPHGKQHMIERPAAVTFLQPVKKAIQIRTGPCCRIASCKSCVCCHTQTWSSCCTSSTPAGRKYARDCTKALVGARPSHRVLTEPSHWTSC